MVPEKYHIQKEGQPEGTDLSGDVTTWLWKGKRKQTQDLQ